MNSVFSEKEKQQFKLKKYIKEHLFDLMIDLIMNTVMIICVIYLCEGTKYFLGVMLAIAYTLGNFFGDIRSYKNDYLNIKPNIQNGD